MRGCLVSRNRNPLKLAQVACKTMAVCSKCCCCPAQILSVITSTCKYLRALFWAQELLGLCTGKMGSARELMAQLWKQLSTNDRSVCIAQPPHPMRHLLYCLPKFQLIWAPVVHVVTPYRPPFCGFLPLFVSLSYSPTSISWNHLPNTSKLFPFELLF